MATLFTKIAQGEIPAYKVAENEDFLAFLDIYPIAKGHTLVIPKKIETDKLFHLEQSTYNDLMAFAYKVAAGLEKAIPCNRVGMAVLGLEIPHAHIHLVPINHEGDISFSKPKLEFSKEEFEGIRSKIAGLI